MSASSFLIVLETDKGEFIPVQDHNQARGYRPVEAWVFGVPRTPQHRQALEAAQAGFAYLQPSQIHYMYFKR